MQCSRFSNSVTSDQLTPVVIKLSDEQARKLSNLLALSQYRR
jgi:hypothetical protein